MNQTPLQLAFEIGRLLNQIHWNAVHAVFLGARAKPYEDLLSNSFAQLETFVVRLYPTERGGEPLRVVTAEREDWDRYLRSERLMEEQCSRYDEIAGRPTSQYSDARAELTTSFSSLVGDPADELRAMLTAEFRAFPKLILAMRLGECVDEGVRSREVHAHIFVRAECTEWRAWDRKKRSRRPARPPRRWRLIPMPKEPGEIPERGCWREQLNCLWESIGIAGEVPAADESIEDTSNRRHQLNERIVSAVRLELARLPDVGWGKDTNDPDWPQDDGWHVRGNEIAFRGKIFRTSGKLLNLLKALVETRRPLSSIDLIRSVWPEQAIDEGLKNNFRTHMTKLRRLLRRELNLRGVKPIQSKIDNGYGFALNTDAILKAMTLPRELSI